MKMSENPEKKNKNLEPCISTSKLMISCLNIIAFLRFSNMFPFPSVVQDFMFIAVTIVIKHRTKLDKKKLLCALPEQFTSLLKT